MKNCFKDRKQSWDPYVCLSCNKWRRYAPPDKHTQGISQNRLNGI